jgi:CRISPR-associated protein Csm3
MKSFRLKKVIILDFVIHLRTGLRIGGSKETFEIGGIDNPVIKLTSTIYDYYGKDKHLLKDTPYIPGSSLKGKLRSLLEWALGRVEAMKNQNKAGKPCDCGKCDVCIVFGTGSSKTIENLPVNELPGPPRAIFYDIYLTEKSYNNLRENLTEVKVENRIDRITSRAEPRRFERIPAGSEFEGRIVYFVYEDDDFPKRFKSTILTGLSLLEDNYLGGSGSRGYGRVKFKNLKLIEREIDYYLKGKEETIREFEDVKALLSSIQT